MALLLVAAGVWVSRSIDLSWTGAIGTTRGWVEPLGAWGPLAFVGVCVAAALVHAPELVVVALGGVLFGRLGGFVYGWVGAVTSSAICFLLARYLFRDAVRASLTRLSVLNIGPPRNCRVSRLASPIQPPRIPSLDCTTGWDYRHGQDLTVVWLSVERGSEVSSITTIGGRRDAGLGFRPYRG